MVEPYPRRRARRTDDAASGAGQNGVLALKGRGVNEPAVRLHEEESGAREFPCESVYVAAQYGGQVGIGHGGRAARHEPNQGADFVTHRYALKAGPGSDCRKLALLRRKLPGVNQSDRAGLKAIRARAPEGGLRTRGVDRF